MSVSSLCAVAVGVVLAFAGCVGDTPAATPDGGVDTGVACGAGTKSCNAQCVQVNDPKYGCDPVTCSACPADPAKHQAPICDGNAKCGFGTTCDTGFGDCDGNPGNGCETNTGTDVANCGACKNACGTTNTSAVACTAGKCAPTCTAGFSHCSTKDSDGCEVNTGGTDAKNCGACGHDCQGGLCAAGVCQVKVLASGEFKPTPLTVDPGSTGNVYWGNVYFNYVDASGQKVRWIQKNASAPAATLWSSVDTTQGQNSPSIAGLTVAGNFVYWTVFRCDSTKTFIHFGAKNGSGSIGDVKDSGNGGWNGPWGIASDSTNVYWSVRGCGGAEPRNIVTSVIGSNLGTAVLTDNTNTAPSSFAIAVEDGAQGSLFWPNTGSGLRKVSKDGLTNVKLDNQASFVAINKTNVYFAYTTVLYMIGKDGKCGSSLVCPISLATSAEGITSIAADDQNVYWTSTTGSAGHVYRTKADGTQATPTTLSSAQTYPMSIALDDVSAYWVDQFAGSVQKLAK